MKHAHRTVPLTALSLATAAMIAGCGGGSDPIQATPTVLSGQVVDGYITGANLCLDLNSNGSCDTGEPTGKSGDKGAYSITVPAGTSVTGMHLIATIPEGAIDSDAPNTPITLPYKMLAPAEMPTVVSPLTTIVSSKMIVDKANLVNARLDARKDLALPDTYDFAKDHVATNDTVARNVAKVVAAVLAVKVGTDALTSTNLSATVTQTKAEAPKAAVATDVKTLVSAILNQGSSPTPTPSSSGFPDVTFDDPTVKYTPVSFGGNVSSIVIDPVSGTGNVAKLVKNKGAETWAGTTISEGVKVPFSGTGKTLTLRVHAPSAGTTIRLKVENAAVKEQTAEVDAKTTGSGWQTLSFDFGKVAAETAELNLMYTFDKISVFPDYGKVGAAETTYYVDDLKFVATTAAPAPTPAPSGDTGTCTTTSTQNCLTMSEATAGVFGFEGLGTGSAIADDPVDAKNKVAKLVKVASGKDWAGATLYLTANDKSIPRAGFEANKVVTLRVYSSAAGETIRLKFEDATNGAKNLVVDATTTKANAWETLVFDFAKLASDSAAYNAANTYNMASVFPKFLGPVTSDTTYYFDELKYSPYVAPAPTPTPTPTPTPSPTATLIASFDETTPPAITTFGGAAAVIDANPTGETGNGLKITRNGGEVWGGVWIAVSPIVSNQGSKQVSARVYSPKADVKFAIKADFAENQGTGDVHANETVKVGWQTLTWNLTNLDAAKTYTRFVILPNLGTVDTNQVYYIDDIKYTAYTAPAPATFSTLTFDDAAVSYSLHDFGGTTSTIVVDPVSGSGKVAKVVKGQGAETWAGTTMATASNKSIAKIPFTTSAKTMTLRVHAPSAGIPIRLKVEDVADPTHSAETETKTTAAGWQTLTFDFGSVATGTAALNLSYSFTMASAFPDFGTVGKADTFYFDDLKFVP